LFDAGISAGTGIALVGSPLLLGTPLAFLAPIADPLIVDRAGAVSVEAALQQRCHDAVAADLKRQGCTLVELAMVK